MTAVEFKNISKTYRRAMEPAVRDVSLNINAGERIGLIGANGSGKTTLIRLLMNFVLADEGSIRIFGETDLEKNRHLIGYVPERQEGMDNFTPRELLNFSFKMSGKKTNTKVRVDELLAFAELSDVADQLISDFSKGMWQRINICAAIVHQPKILLLDEPMSGLDPDGQKTVRDFIARLKDLTIIYASHNLGDIQAFCDSVVILHKGAVIQKLSLEEIEQEVFFIEAESGARSVLEKMPELNAVISDSTNGFVHIELTAEAADAQKLLAVLDTANISVKKLRSRGVLENLYHQYVTNVTQNA